MRVTLRAVLSRLVPILFLALCFPQSVDVVASSRFFQMSVWTYEGNGVSWDETAALVDVPMFGEGNEQPPGRSIMRANTWLTSTPFAVEGVPRPDWSRVLAVVIDEPYTGSLPDGEDGEIPTNPCWDSNRQETVTAIRWNVMNAAATLHKIAPRTRVWVNFHQYEVDWMRDPICPQDLNDPVIDVVSLDSYDAFVSSLRDEYDWFVSSIPEQQIALVPGTFYEDDWSFIAKTLAKLRLKGYFDYANHLNRRCDVGLGRVGPTGSYDGCRLWIVAGWSATPQIGPYLGLLHPKVAPLSEVWSSELSKVRRVDQRTPEAVQLGQGLRHLEAREQAFRVAAQHHLLERSRKLQARKLVDGGLDGLGRVVGPKKNL